MEQYLCLKASAGTGKTFSLVVRYISLLYLEQRPEDILCVTFTNKATNEMESRIIYILQNLHNEKDYLEHISNNSGLSIDFLLENRSKIYQKLLKSNMNILTMDKFLNRILRSFCWYKGINHDFKIDTLDQNDIQEKFLSSLDAKQYEKLIKLTVKENLSLDELFRLFETLYIVLPLYFFLYYFTFFNFISIIYPSFFRYQVRY
jgi:exodeoxyribonuclease V beta subunit